MAIYHFTTHTMGRASGHSAVAAAAYRSGSRLVDERTGEVHDFTRKGGVLSAEIVTPHGVPVPEREHLWNAAEAAEKRKDARTAREWRLALPHELSTEAQKAVAHRMAQAIADRYGVAVDVCIHAPDRQGDERNFHAHMLATTRRINADGSLGLKSAIELANKDRQKAGIVVTTQEEIRDLRREWAAIANAALENEGQSVRIDYRSYDEQGVSLMPTRHIGADAVAIERRGGEAERIDLHNADRQEQARQVADRPELILDKLTATKAIFDRRDIAAELDRYIDDAAQFQSLLAKLEASPQLVELEPASGGRPARYSTCDMVETERRMADTAQRLSVSGRHGVSVATARAAIDGAGTLSEEQKAAVRHVTHAGSLAVVIGDAGTGKSFSMKVAREAWEAQGFTVRGAALAGRAADELQAGSGMESRTLASLEHAWKEGRNKLSSRDVLVIDEAGMVGSRQLGRVLDAAEKAGAKVVLLGDHKQLAAIEAGAAFRAFVQHVGAAEITEVRRQRHAWAREAGQHLARGSVADGLRAYDERGHVKVHGSREAARKSLATAYVQGAGGGSQIVLAHSNKDVLSLNEAIREARKDRGELAGGARFMTERGGREFAAGDRIVFLRNDRALGVKNGTLATVERADHGALSVRLDNGEIRQVQAEQYAAIDHGYAVTIHKAQGVTVDHAYLLATPGMDRSLAYVGMTRHRESATLFAATEDFGNRGEDAARVQLTRTLARERPKESTLDFADRRGFDGESVLSRWIERGRVKLGELAKRAEQAIERVRDRAGRTNRTPTDAAISSSYQTTSSRQEQVPKQRASELAGEHARAKSDRVAAAKTERNQSSVPQTIDEVRLAAAQRLRLELEAQGKNPNHHAVEIKHEAEVEAIRWASTRSRQPDVATQRALSANDAKFLAPYGAPTDEATLRKLLDQRSAERRDRAAAATARLERLDDALALAYRAHLTARPKETRGLAAMLGRGQYEKDAAAWSVQEQRLVRRIRDVQRRRRVTGNIAREASDAERLAARKLRREQPDLWLRVENLRALQQADRARATHELLQQQLMERRERSRDRGPTR